MTFEIEVPPVLLRHRNAELPVTQSPKSAADTGEVRAAGASLRWTREAGTVEYELSYDAPSACYSAGELQQAITVSNGLTTLAIEADVAFRDGICAQTIKSLVFQGAARDIHGPFAVFATVSDGRSGRQITLTAAD